MLKRKKMTREATIEEQEKINAARILLREVGLDITDKTEFVDSKGGAVVPRKGF